MGTQPPPAIAGDRVESAPVVPVIEESLEVRRRTVDTGAVQIGKVVTEQVVPVTESLTSEYVDTARVAIGRVISEPALVRHEGDVMIVPVVEERLVLRKELFLVEELHVTRRRETRQASEQVTLRRESVRVRRLDPVTQQWEPEGGERADARPPGPDPPA